MRKPSSLIMIPVIGYVCFMMTWSLVWADAPTQLGTIGSTEGTSYSSATFLESLTVLLLLLLGSFCFYKTRIVGRKICMTVTLVSTVILLVGICMRGESMLEANSFVSSMTFSIGIMGLFVAWVLFLGTRSQRDIVVIIGAGGVIGLVLYYLLSQFSLPLLVIKGLGIGLIIGCCASLFFCFRAIDYSSPAFYPYSRATCSYRTLFIRQASDFICMISVGFVWSLICPAVLAPSSGQLNDMTSIAGMAGSALILFLIPVLERISKPLVVVFRLSFPVLLAALLLLPVMGIEYAGLSIFVTYFVVTVMSLIIVVNCCTSSIENGLRPVVVFGVIYAFFSFFSRPNTLILDVTNAARMANLSSLLITVLACVYVLSFVLLWCYQRETRKGKTTTPLQGVPAKSERNSDIPTTDSKTEQCAKLARRIDLSEREQEIVLLTASGRDANHIGSELGISKNTVQSHFKNIYVKAGVHKKQELLDLLDAEE